MVVKYFLPSDDLAGIVKYYWFVDSTADIDSIPQNTISPSGYPELIFNFGFTPTVNTQKTISNNTPLCFVAGQISQPIVLGVTNSLNCLCVKLQPFALPQLFGYSSHKFTDSVTDLSDLDNQQAGNIHDELSEAKNNLQRFIIIETFLRLKLKKYKKSCLSIPDMVNEIIKMDGLLTYNDLTKKMSFSSSTFQRKFKNQVGMSPKYFIRIIRFNYVFYLLKHNLGLSLQDIVYRCGYYDLSHLINEFHEFSGNSPYKYFKTNHIINDLFAGIR